jgi:hypothetical protein
MARYKKKRTEKGKDHHKKRNLHLLLLVHPPLRLVTISPTAMPTTLHYLQHQ